MNYAICAARIFDGEKMLHDHAVIGEGERITGIVETAKLPAGINQVKREGGILAPVFIDVQVNGGGGVLLNNARIFARVYVPEHLRAQVMPGETLSVSIDGVEKSFEGRVRWVSSDATFTPYFALTQHDRSRLSYLAEIDVAGAEGLPVGIPLQVDFPVR